MPAALQRSHCHVREVATGLNQPSLLAFAGSPAVAVNVSPTLAFCGVMPGGPIWLSPGHVPAFGVVRPEIAL